MSVDLAGEVAELMRVENIIMASVFVVSVSSAICLIRFSKLWQGPEDEFALSEQP